MNLPTHKCRVCGALWRVQLPMDTLEPHETWSLCSEKCGKCCDNVTMGEQIVQVTIDDIASLLKDRQPVASASAWPKGRRGDDPPPAKQNWNHSDRVLVFYAGGPEPDRISKWSIAYFHHEPPFSTKSQWVDFNTSRGTPDLWWPLPEAQEKGDPNGQ